MADDVHDEPDAATGEPDQADQTDQIDEAVDADEAIDPDVEGYMNIGITPPRPFSIPKGPASITPATPSDSSTIASPPGGKGPGKGPFPGLPA